MTRKYMNERWCVRCGRETATPYLRDNAKLFTCLTHNEGIDLGCGNGRNTRFAEKLGYKMTAFDMAGDKGTKFILGKDRLPHKKQNVHLVLANYVFMFLSAEERQQVINEINRVTEVGGMLVVELYPAKDSYTKNDKEVTALRDELLVLLNCHSEYGWYCIKKSKDRFIAMKVTSEDFLQRKQSTGTQHENIATHIKVNTTAGGNR